MSVQTDRIPAVSSLIDTALEAQLQPLLGRILTPVTMVSILDEGEKSLEMGAFLRHLAALSPFLSVEFLSPGESPEADSLLDVSMLPATGFRGQDGFCRAFFHGVPGGKEINGFLAALLACAGAAKPLEDYIVEDFAFIRKPANLWICVSLSCRHCAQTVISAQQIAGACPLVRAHMVDANLYPALVQAYDIAQVPLVLCDGTVLAKGSQSVESLCALLKNR